MRRKIVWLVLQFLHEVIKLSNASESASLLQHVSFFSEPIFLDPRSVQQSDATD